MKISIFDSSQSQEAINLFTEVFSRSGGQEEGALIGGLVSDLITTTGKNDLAGFVSFLDEKIVGCVFFSRLTLPGERTAFILSPVAIAAEQQGKGMGQQLIRHGIKYLKSREVELLFTYGDPAFYSKVGFRQIREDIVKAPLKLTQPEGWLAQSLKNGVIDMVHGTTKCVKALNKQEYW